MKFNFKKFVTVLIFSLTIIPAIAGNKGNNNKDGEFDWDPIMDAIIHVESRGNEKARNGIHCGAMQISPAMVQDINKILQKRGINKRYTLADRFSVKKSREMFVIIQSHYNPKNNVEHAVRSWNGGQHYKVKSTERYFQKVMSRVK